MYDSTVHIIYPAAETDQYIFQQYVCRADVSTTSMSLCSHFVARWELRLPTHRKLHWLGVRIICVCKNDEIQQGYRYVNDTVVLYVWKGLLRKSVDITFSEMFCSPTWARSRCLHSRISLQVSWEARLATHTKLHWWGFSKSVCIITKYLAGLTDMCMLVCMRVSLSLQHQSRSALQLKRGQ